MNDQLVEEVVDALDPTPAHAAEWPVSRRRLLQGLASVGALSLGPGGAQAQPAGTVSANTAFLSNYGSASTASGYDIEIDGDTYSFDGDDTIGLPNANQGVEVITPSGATAAEVVGPGGNVLFRDPVQADLQAEYDASTISASDGDTITSAWGDSSNNTNDATVSGSPVYRTGEINGEPAVDFGGNSGFFDTGITVDTTSPRTVYAVVHLASSSGTKYWYSAFDSSGTDNRFYNGITSSDEVQLGYGNFSQNVGTVTTGSYVIVTTTYGSGSGEAFEDNSSEGTMSYGGVGQLGVSNYIGGQNKDGSLTGGLDGSVAHLLDYQADHDSSTRQAVWDYLNNIYSVF